MGTIAVIVTSYNRPRLLAECLASIDGADQVIVADDGSDFDVTAITGGVTEAYIARRSSPAERMTTPRMGRLVNQALRLVKTDYVLAVLNDDDLLAPGWLRFAAEALDAHPEWHMVRGDWGTFNDGETPDPARLCRFSFELPITAGNLVYRMSCVRDEGQWWDERSVAVHDAAMLAGYIPNHGGGSVWLGRLPHLAGYRREHSKTVSNHSRHGGDAYLQSAAVLFSEGSME